MLNTSARDLLSCFHLFLFICLSSSSLFASASSWHIFLLLHFFPDSSLAAFSLSLLYFPSGTLPPPVPSQPCCILFPCSLFPLDFDCLLFIHVFTPSSPLSLLLPILFCPFIHLCLINLHSPFVSSSSVLSFSFIISCLFLPLIFLLFPASSTESQLTHLATRTNHDQTDITFMLPTPKNMAYFVFIVCKLVIMTSWNGLLPWS